MKKKILIWTQDYKKFIIEWWYYVDKTKVVYELLTTNNYYFLSRPRRFGKSLTLSMMRYLYLWEKELFKNTYLYDKWDFTQTNPVVYLSLAWYSEFKDTDSFIKENLNIYIDDKIYKYTDFIDSLDIWLLTKRIFEKTWKQSVVLVDEYDKIVLSNLQDVKKAEYYRRYFWWVYAWVKDADPYIKMFWLTWLTKILKMSIFSTLNNLQDISFHVVWYNIMWYTWKDIETNFSEELEEISKKYNLSLEKVKNKCQSMYNWYNFWSENWDTIFNPWNINNLILQKKFEFYWSNTGIPSAIVEYVKAWNINVLELTEKINTWKLTIDEISLKLENLDHILPEVFFLNSWYLTIKTARESIYILDFPNLETKKVVNRFFIELLRPRYDLSLLIEISNLFYEAIVEKDKEKLKEWLNLLIYKFLWDTPYEWMNHNPEWWLKSFFWMILIMNNMWYFGEVQNIKWRKDMVLLKDNIYYILEFKVNENIEKAIQQIDKLYVPYLQDWKAIIKIWVNWDRENKEFEVGIF